MKKWILVLAVAAAVIIAAVVAVRQKVINETADAVYEATGFGFMVQSIRPNPFKGTLELSGVHLLNPEGFHERVALVVDRLYIEAPPGDLLATPPHLRRVDIRVPVIHVIRNEEGEINIEEFADMARFWKEKPSPSAKDSSREHAKPAAEASTETTPAWRIDELHITVDRATVTDYDARGEGDPLIETVTLDIDRTFRDLTHFRQVSTVLGLEIGSRVWDVLSPAPVQP